MGSEAPSTAEAGETDETDETDEIVGSCLACEFRRMGELHNVRVVVLVVGV